MSSIVFALLAGCGSSNVPLKGKVTLDGAPLKGAVGMVIFIPSSGPTATAELKSDGTFDLVTGTERGLAPGEYTVLVNATEPPVDAGRDAPEMIPKSLIPAKYGDPTKSDLKLKIDGSKNEIEVPLKN